MVSLWAAAVAAAVGTAVHDSRSHLYAQQAQTRHAVTATVTDVHVTGAEPVHPRKVITVSARWAISGTEHSGAVRAKPTVETGDRVGIWVDYEGEQVDKPMPLSRAGMDVALAALAIWLSVIAAAAAVAALGRAILDRVRNTGWKHDIDNLLCHGGGHTNSQR